MVSSKTFLLLVFLFLLLPTASASTLGGHDRQRLALTFLSELQHHYLSAPLGARLDFLPVSFQEDSSAHQYLYPLLITLTEEGWLDHSMTALQVSTETNREVFTREHGFSWRDPQLQPKVLLGEVSVLQISSIRRSSPELDQTQQYQIEFQWRLANPEDWLWAPALDEFEFASFLRQAQSAPQTSTALFEWHESERWRLVESPILIPSRFEIDSVSR